MQNGRDTWDPPCQQTFRRKKDLNELKQDGKLEGCVGSSVRQENASESERESIYDWCKACSDVRGRCTPCEKKRMKVSEIRM